MAFIYTVYKKAIFKDHKGVIQEMYDRLDKIKEQK